jgi:ribonuclease HI
VKDDTIYTDGACLGNPGPGGWGVYFEKEDLRLSGHLNSTGNNRAELQAVLAALKALEFGGHAKIVTDSRNVIGWLSEGWNRNDPNIRHLCAQIERVIGNKCLSVRYKHVHGHSGVPGNEIADQLATEAAREVEPGTLYNSDLSRAQKTREDIVPFTVAVEAIAGQWLEEGVPITEVYATFFQELAYILGEMHVDLHYDLRGE